MLKNLYSLRKMIYFALCFVAYPEKAAKKMHLVRDMRLRYKQSIRMNNNEK